MTERESDTDKQRTSDLSALSREELEKLVNSLVESGKVSSEIINSEIEGIRGKTETQTIKAIEQSTTPQEATSSPETELLKQEAITLFRQFLENVRASELLVINEQNMLDPDKGYDLTRPGGTPGSRESDPFCLRSRLLNYSHGTIPKYIEELDMLMGDLSATNSVPWEKLQTTLKEVMIKRKLKID